MNALAIAQSTFAIAIVVGLLGVFMLLLLGSFVRARRGEVRAGAGVAGRPPAAARPTEVLSRRDFFRRGLLTSFAIFLAQFGGASLAFLWPNLTAGSAP
ncbi:MAG TPA: hypothetical protein VF972_05560 [Actinomycetota bacterium]